MKRLLFQSFLIRLATAPVKAIHVLIALVFLQHAVSVRAASLDSIDSEIEKANQILKSAGSDSRSSAAERAATLSAAIDRLHTVLESVEKDSGLSNEQREAKCSEVLALIFWCKKMMPLDLSGRSIAIKPSTSPSPSDTSRDQGNTLSQSGPAPAAAKSVEKATDLDEMAFNRAKSFATAHPNELETAVTWFESVAFYFPKSQWGERAAQEARQARAKLDAFRAPLENEVHDRIQHLELGEALDALTKKLAGEMSDSKKTQVLQMKKDVENLQAVFQNVLKCLENQNLPANISAQDLGVATKGWLRQATKVGVSYTSSPGEDGPASKSVSWSEFGAKAMIRLAARIMPSNGEMLQQLSMAATTAEDFPKAQELFSKLLTTDPQRVKNLTAYFDRAQSGYKASAEGTARTQLAAAKALFTSRKPIDGMQRLTSLQAELASNSSLQSLLTEVQRYRSMVRRQYQIDEFGNPITAFERTIRNVFAGDVTVDELTGNIEATYDFSTPEQLRDWSIVDYFGKESMKPDWRHTNSSMSCSGMNTILIWKFPLNALSISADMTFLDATHKVVIYTEMSKDKPYGTSAWCRDGQSRIGRGKVNDWGWYSKTRFIWRTGELANVAFSYDPDSKYPLDVEVNGECAVRGQFPHGRGQFGFCFDGGRGTITNVHIKGVLDMDQLKLLTASK